MLWMFQRVFWNPLVHEENRELYDMNLRELLAVLPLLCPDRLDRRPPDHVPVAHGGGGARALLGS